MFFFQQKISPTSMTSSNRRQDGFRRRPWSRGRQWFFSCPSTFFTILTPCRILSSSAHAPELLLLLLVTLMAKTILSRALTSEKFFHFDRSYKGRPPVRSRQVSPLLEFPPFMTLTGESTVSSCYETHFRRRRRGRWRRRRR